MTSVALIDDHVIFCDSLSSLINDFDDFSVCWCANSGAGAIQYLNQEINIPDIILLDISMPVMSGIEIAKWLHENKKEIKILALTMEEDESNVIQMLQYGVRGYLLKSVNSEELRAALDQVARYGYFYTPAIMGTIHKQIEKRFNRTSIPELSPREEELLHLLCTDMSYAQISNKIFLSGSTVDTYRARLFEKFEVKNRIGLVIKAVHLGMVTL